MPYYIIVKIVAIMFTRLTSHLLVPQISSHIIAAWLGYIIHVNVMKVK